LLHLDGIAVNLGVPAMFSGQYQHCINDIQNQDYGQDGEIEALFHERRFGDT
jgi:hypothetical protein